MLTVSFPYGKISLYRIRSILRMTKPIILLLKRILKIAGIAVVSFLFLCTVIGLFYSNEVKTLMVDQLNKNLNTEIHVKEFSFSILRHFPYASFDMKQFTAKEVTDIKEKDTLLYADHVSLLFNITSVFSKNFSVKKIVLKNGKVNVLVDKAGNNNYHFWKTTTDSGSTSAIDLKKITLVNMQVRYLNLHDRQDYLLNAKEGELSGNFSGDEFVLKSNAELLINHFIVHGTNYIPEKEIKIRSGLKVNSKTNEYCFTNSRVQMGDLVFDVDGTIFSLPETTKLNLLVTAHEATLQSFMSIVPAEYAGNFGDFKSKGKINFTATIKGNDDDRHVPEIVVNFNIKDGKISPKKNDIALEKIVATGSFHSGSVKQKNILQIPSLTAMLGGRKLNASLTIEDFNNPFLTLQASADLDLSRVRHFMKLDTLESLTGDLAMNISFAGKIKDLPRYHADALYKVKAAGTITLKDAAFKIKKNPLDFKNINGNFSLSDNNVNVASLTGNISSSDFQLKGIFRNFITFLLIPGQQADVDAQLSSNEINLDELMTNKAQTTENDTAYQLKFNPRLVCRLDVEAGSLHFRKFFASHVKGKIHLANQVITGKGLNFSSMNGLVTMNALINASRKDSVIISCEANCTSLDITQLFYEMENFDQSTMTDKNVKGKISAAVTFKSSWTPDLRINPASAVSTFDITIDNGELNNFRPMLALSKYLKLADLKHIKFATLKNQVRISNRKIFIPAMEINSSALNLHISGIHDFDNMVDYKLQMLLSDVLGKKVKDQNTEFGQIEDDGLGRTNLFLTMKGPVDDPKFGLDKKAVADKFKSDVKAGKQNLKNLLTEEFSSHKKETSSVQKKKKEEMQVDWGQEESRK